MQKVFLLVGAGLRCEHLNERAKEVIRNVGEVWVDVYTSPFPGGLKNCVSRIRPDVKVATREVLEGSFEFSDSVAIVVPGDPLAATAHAALIVEAKKRGYEVKVFSNVSALQAARSKSGLSQYRFGRVVTLMYPKEGIDFTESVYYAIKDNDQLNLHTIVLLETGYGKDMTAQEASELLSKYEDLRDRKVLAMARLCWDDELVVLTRLHKLKDIDMGRPPHLLVFPSPKLHPIEEEAMTSLSHVVSL